MYFENQDKDINVYNLGICGDTTTDLLNRFENESLARHPDVIIFGIGTNDSQIKISENKSKNTPDQFKENIQKLTQVARKFTDNVIFIGLTLVDENRTNPWKPDKSYLNNRIDELNQVLKNHCQAENLKFISMNRVIDADDLEDGLHPNSAGHKKMFQKIIKEISLG